MVLEASITLSAVAFFSSPPVANISQPTLLLANGSYYIVIITDIPYKWIGLQKLTDTLYVEWRGAS
jgi:hypothetical protein